MTHLITCMGEILIDFLPLEENGRTVGFNTHAGGSLMNVAVTIARLGQPVALASKVSTDAFGRFLRSHVEAQGVDPRFLLQSSAQSTLAFVSMVGGEPEYNFYTTDTADTLVTVEELPPELFAETRVLHYGSISLLRGTTPAAVLATAERLKGHALLSCDPNLRPGLVDDEQAYRTLLDRALALADLIKISAADLSWLMPNQPIEQAAAGLLARGAALVVVTRGGEGVYALRRNADDVREIRLPSFKITVADTVGAGDSFCGGLLTSLAERNVVSREALEQMPEKQLTASLRFATGVSALTCTRAGADPPRRAEAEQFFVQQGVHNA